MPPSNKSRPSSPAPQGRPARELLSQVLQRIGNPQCDIFIVGDGSGSGWAHACGWASVLIDMQTGDRRLFYGGMDCGSVNFAESMPYLQSLTWYDNHRGKDLLQQLGHLNVVVLTDSQVIANWGNRTMSPEGGDPPRKQLALWGGMLALRRVGYHCRFHWAPRMTTELNWAADLMAGLTRREVMNAADPTYVAGTDYATRAAAAVGNLVFHDPESGRPLSPYEVNPHAQPAGI